MGSVEVKSDQSYVNHTIATDVSNLFELFNCHINNKFLHLSFVPKVQHLNLTWHLGRGDDTIRPVKASLILSFVPYLA